MITQKMQNLRLVISKSCLKLPKIKLGNTEIFRFFCFKVSKSDNFYFFNDKQ